MYKTYIICYYHNFLIFQVLQCFSGSHKSCLSRNVQYCTSPSLIELHLPQKEMHGSEYQADNCTLPKITSLLSFFKIVPNVPHQSPNRGILFTYSKRRAKMIWIREKTKKWKKGILKTVVYCTLVFCFCMSSSRLGPNKSSTYKNTHLWLFIWN